MKQIYILTLIAFLSISSENLKAQTIWTGSTMTFTKANNADWTLEANQDRITNNVWITRANTEGIFNIATEDNYIDFSSPADTEWALGTTENIESLTFQNWEDTSASSPPDLVNQDMVVHLITDDIYIDIKFTSWQSGGQGGGFTYERSTNQSLSTSEIELEKGIKLLPNPADDYIKILGLIGNESFIIYNVLGAEIKKGIISNNEQIDIRDFKKGLYFMKFDNENTIKFIKE